MSKTVSPRAECTPVSRRWRVFLLVASYLVVTFGQPAWCWWLGLVAAAVGYALFWRVMVEVQSRRGRFLWALGWYGAVQATQLSWLWSHPYNYIIVVHIVLAIALGVQFGLVSLLVTPQRLARGRSCWAIAGLWTLNEWVRLFVMTGFTFNPAGLALAGHHLPMQMASLFGLFGLTFWVVATNLTALRVMLFGFRKKTAIILATMVLVPYLFGVIHLSFHHRHHTNDHTFSAVVVHTMFPPEELTFSDVSSLVTCAGCEWKWIVGALSERVGEDNDLIIMPEGVVPLGSVYPFYRAEDVINVFADALGDDAVASLPPLQRPLARKISTSEGDVWMVSNAYWVQAIANALNADVLVGLEDSEKGPSNRRSVYNAALWFSSKGHDNGKAWKRYAKQVLLPMAECIPYACLKPWAAKYGIQDSYVRGKGPKVFNINGMLTAPSVCYEDTFGHLVRESRLQGAQLLVNVTNDVWYPRSKLEKQHFDLARLRTIENGVPLVRSCNYGVSGVVDSLGRIVVTSETMCPDSEWTVHAISVDVPTYTYKTPYTWWGDAFIVALSALATMALFPLRRH